MNSTSPAVGVTAAYIGDGVFTRQAIFPDAGVDRVDPAVHSSVGSFVPQPFASPVYGTVASHLGSGPSLNNAHQSIALT